MTDKTSDVTADVVDVAAEELFRVCLFRIGEDHYAIPVETLTEIITPPKIFPVPTTPGHVLGVINLRGNIIPVVDIRPVLSLPQDRGMGQIAILRYNQIPMGIGVDAVIEIASIPKSRFLDIPAEHALQQSGTPLNRFMKAIIQRENGVAALLDVERIFDAIKLG